MPTTPLGLRGFSDRECGVLRDPHHRQFSPEFKLDAVELVRSSGRPVAQVAKELGCGESSLSLWMANDRIAPAVADPKKFSVEVADSDEVRRLRRKVAELEVEREILKRSMVFWVKESNG